MEIANVESLSKLRVGRYGIDIENFEDFALKVLEDALPLKKVIVIDEIGFIQMLSTSFQKRVQEIVSDNHVVLGTVPIDSHREIDKIKYSKAAKIIGLNNFNREAIPDFLVKEILNALDSRM